MFAIVCYDMNGAIGKSNKLLYKIPQDMDFFTKMTKENGVVLMGSKTHKSLGIKQLKDRLNIVISKNKTTFYYPDNITTNEWNFCNIDLLASLYPDAMVIGGEQIYRAFMEHIYLIYATEIYHEKEADTFFPILDTKSWYRMVISEIQDTAEDPAFDFIAYARKDKYDLSNLSLDHFKINRK